MPGSLVSDYGIGDTNFDNMMLTLDKAYKSFKALTLTEITSNIVPAITAGSWVDCNGGLYKFDSEEAISTTDPVTSLTVADGKIWIYLISGGATITAAFSATDPVFSDSKQGWYSSSVDSGNARCIGRVVKQDVSYEILWSGKQVLNNETSNFRTPFEVDKIWGAKTVPTGNAWKGVVWSPELSLFCTVSANGTSDRAMTSPDGITWTTRTSAADNDWQGLCWSPELSLFCAVSTSGTSNRVMTSPDGITWTIRTSAVDNDWMDICWSPELSLFCAVARTGTGNRVMTSPNGTTWTPRTNPVDNSWRAVCWSPELSLFCAVSDTGTSNRVMTSPDGITWTSRTSVGSINLLSISWSPELGLFCACGANGSVSFIYSSDGITWTLGTNTTPTGGFRTISWSPELSIFIAIGFSAATPNGAYVASSTDGVTWKSLYHGLSAIGERIAWSPELLKFCSTSGGSASFVFLSSYGVM